VGRGHFQARLIALTPTLALAGTAKPPRGALARIEIGNDAKRRLHDRNDDELGQPVERLQREVGTPAVPAAHHQFALVIGVDQPDQIAQDNAVLVTQPGPGQDQRREAGIGDVDRDAGSNQFGLSRQECQWDIDARAQVESGGAGRCVGGQIVADAFVQDAKCDDGLGQGRVLAKSESAFLQ